MPPWVMDIDACDLGCHQLLWRTVDYPVNPGNPAEAIRLPYRRTGEVKFDTQNQHIFYY
jgi:hypothetical protein